LVAGDTGADEVVDRAGTGGSVVAASGQDGLGRVGDQQQIR